VAQIQRIQKSFAPKVKEVRYLNKNFGEFRQSLIDFAKVYFPETYRDFNEASPGMMFIEMASYVGDVLSYYVDTQFRENLVTFAQEPENIIKIAQAFGFKAKPAAAASTQADIFQLVPSILSGSAYVPDERFYLRVGENSLFTSKEFGDVTFRSVDEVDFNDSADRSISVYSTGPDNNPNTFLVRKKIKLEAGELKTSTRTFGDPIRFSQIVLPDANALGVVKIEDSNGFEWQEVDYLAQDVIIDDIENDSPVNDPNQSVPPRRLIKFKKQPRRFVTRYNEDFLLEILFGSGVLEDDDELISLDPLKIASDEYESRLASTTVDPADFLSSSTFGLTPSNTELTITYIVGGGIQSNVPVGTIGTIRRLNVLNDPRIIGNVGGLTSAEQTLFDETVNSVAINNTEPATGGKGQDSVEEIRQNALAFFNSQNRLVTAEDYTVRVYSMPPRFGAVSKAFVVEADQLRKIQEVASGTPGLPDVETTGTDEFPPADAERGDRVVTNFSENREVNIYVLGYNSDKQLRTLNRQTKANLKKYLSSYKILTDELNILDAFIVNIGVNFSIRVFKNKNANDVLANCLDSVKTFFDIDRWDINQPILINDLRLEIGRVEGVQSVRDIEIVNKYAYKDGFGYENFRYDIKGTSAFDQENETVWPSVDPMIFEVRFPDKDIVGNAVQ